MLLTLLLAAKITPADLDWPYWLGAVVIGLFLGYSTIRQIVVDLTGGPRREKEELLAWRKKMDACVETFMPEGDIQNELTKLGRQIGDNEGKIKLLHDRGEEVQNKLDMRVTSLEQHHTNLSGLPDQVNNLKTDHRVLASEVRTLATNIKELSDKQERHFRELMEAVQRISFTQGQLSK